MTTATMIFIGIIVFLGIIALWFIGLFNTLIRQHALLKEGWSGIDVQLKRRADLIPNLVAVVKQYSIHEKGVLEEVTRMRTAAMGATTIESKVQAESGLTGALKTLFAVAENYPNLKANENFAHLHNDLGKLEEELQLARRYYNGAARNFNVVVQSFPSNIVARMTGFVSAPYFELDSESERKAPTISFE